MRTCNNCAFQLRKKSGSQDLCIKIGNLCRVAVGRPERDSCTDHQYAEVELLPIMDQAVELLDSIRITLSLPNSRKAERIIIAYSHLCTRGDFGELFQNENRVYVEAE
ncbi:MAG: hypothetical protein CVU46_10545 [Chloroflexi bacterium HGW-Chloroflexi-8]|nr:MAG: hypothetical protein CVU46_10545 [Chloroflexi bacterium HGW-Chloroflexi-8]